MGIKNKFIKYLSFIFLGIIIFCYSACYANIFENNFQCIKLKVNNEDLYYPILLNDNEIFFAGGLSHWNWAERKKEKVPAQIYNIKNKTMRNLGSFMNLPRASYKAIKLNDGRVLVVGGDPTFELITQIFEKSSKKSERGVSVDINGNIIAVKINVPAEIYNPKTNLFTSVNTNFSYNVGEHPVITILDDGRVLLLTRSSAEIFDPKTDSFNVVGEKKQNITKSANGISYKKEYYTFYPHSFPNAINLGGNKILIFGRGGSDEHFTTEIFDGNKDKFIPIKFNSKYILQDNTIKISDNKLLSIVGDKSEGSVVIYDIQTNEIIHKKLPYASWGSTLIPLKNNKVLILSGWMDNPDYFIPGIVLEKAIYDIESNRITNLKKRYGSAYATTIYSKTDNMVLVKNSHDNSYVIYKIN